MSKLEVPIIQPRNITEYEYKYKQSKYPQVPKVPFRSIIVASSTGGFSQCLFNFVHVVCVFRGCFSRMILNSCLVGGWATPLKNMVRQLGGLFSQY